MQRISIIADDLTGASDSGVQFARKGLRTHVIFDWTGLSPETASLDAIVIDTDSRAIPGDMAYNRVKSAAEALKQKGFAWIYKKMDSTLRGNIGQEIHAVMDAYGFEAAFIAPAFPKIGRTTVSGVHYLNHIPIHDTEIAKDPKTPVPESDIAKILARQSGLAAVNIHLSTLRQGLDATCNAIRDALSQQQKLFIFDAETDEDLQMIAQLMSAFGSRVLWAGSAGLAQFLPVNGGLDMQKNVLPGSPVDGRVMLVAGSISKVTRDQVSAVNKEPNVAAVEMNACAAIDSPEQRAQEIERCISELTSALSRDLDLSLYAGSSPEQVRAVKMKGEQLGFASSDVSNRIADMLGEISCKVVSANQVKGLVLTGGDTAKAVCKHLGVHGFELLNELEAGIPYGRLLGDVSLTAVTKAGAFGTTQSLVHAMQYLKEGKGEKKMTKPVIGITMGDGAGVGPEIIMKALADPSVYASCRPFVIGDAKILERAGRVVHSPLQLRALTSLSEAAYQLGTVECLDLDLLPADLPFGEVNAEAGHGAFMYLKKAIELANEGLIDAICTAPLNKEALHKGGHIYPGHTEILAELTNTKDYSMMLSAPKLKVIHVTTHVGILDAVKMIEPERVYKVIRLAHDTLQKAGYAAPRIAVCGINPHAGENGLFGYGEEEQKVIPAVERAQKEGIQVVGPLPADTLFFRTTRGDFDIVVAMYHDQGHGPVKVLGLEAGVNITVGLPIIRTSVDHGTAFDIAGKGIADDQSLKEALRQAVELAPRRD